MQKAVNCFRLFPLTRTISAFSAVKMDGHKNMIFAPDQGKTLLSHACRSPFTSGPINSIGKTDKLSPTLLEHCRSLGIIKSKTHRGTSAGKDKQHQIKVVISKTSCSSPLSLTHANSVDSNGTEHTVPHIEPVRQRVLTNVPLTQAIPVHVSSARALKKSGRIHAPLGPVIPVPVLPQNSNPANTNTLRAVHINCQTCREKTDAIRDFLVDENVDLAFVTETWLKESGDEAFSKI